MITRLRITSYRGIEELDTQIPPGGIMAKGRNGSGKTTVLRAIAAALSGQDIGPDAIRIGAERAEILVNLDDLEVRRVLTQEKSTVTVERDIAGARGKVSSPAKFLKDLIGVSKIDPVDLLSADTAEKRRERRARVLAAIPAFVTAEQIEHWTGEAVRGKLDATTHGLEIIAQLRTSYYDRRTAANASAKEARRKADELAREVEKLPERPVDALSSEVARKIRDESARELALLEARAKAALEADERTKSTRARVEDLRRRAAAELDGLTEPTEAALDDAVRGRSQWQERVREIESELEAARAALAKAELWCQTQAARVEQVRAADRRSKDLLAQAADLESAVSLASVQAPSDEEFSVIRADMVRAEKKHEEANYHEQNDCIRAEAFSAEEAAKALEAEADKLDEIVVRLTNDAPAELLATADGIRGLSVRGDQIFVDGVDFDGLSGREQLRFAIEIAKRANAKCRILIVDGLERVGPEDLDAFIDLATADGWQLIATRVEGGERVIEAISSHAVFGEKEAVSA